MTVAYGCCVAHWFRLIRNVAERIGNRPLFALSGQPSICAAYNAILRAVAGRGFDALVLVHDDLEITDPRFEGKVLAALADPDVALVGVAGGISDRSLHWWESPTVGHQMTDSGPIDLGPRTGDVAIIEGSVMVFSPWAVDNLRFDERYTDFRSGYDDICLSATAAGKRVTVVDADTHHHTMVGWRSQAVRERFEESERLFQAKWHGEGL